MKKSTFATGDNDPKIAALLEDLRVYHAAIYEIVMALRAIVATEAGSVDEQVKYGGLLFSEGKPFCGIYAYASHVSMEFSRGCDPDDTHGLLQGSGKLRRHLKFETRADIVANHVQDYVRQAVIQARSDL
jgi:hypothetical protein